MLLLILRLLSAAVLLAFLLLIAWLINKDIRAMTDSLSAQEQHHGHLLVVASESDKTAVGSLIPLLPVTSIGRASSNTIVLDDNYASSKHSLITRRGDRWWLEDLGSRNGTLLNDLPMVEAAIISPGDVITIGSTKLKLEVSLD